MGVNLAGTEGCVCIYLREGCTMLDSQQPLSKDLVTLLLLWKGELRSRDGKQNFSYVFISHLGSIIVTLLPALLPDLNPFPRSTSWPFDNVPSRIYAVHILSDVWLLLDYGQRARGQTLKKNWFISPRTYQLPIVAQLRLGAGGGLHGHLLPSILGFCLAWVCSGLCILWQLVCVHMCTCPTVTRRHYFLVPIFCLWLLHSCPIYSKVPEPWEEGVWYTCPI